MVLAAMAAGCSVIPLRSLWALRSFELQQLDGALLRMPVYLPAGVEAQRDALRVHVRAERGNAAAEVLEETLTLRPGVGAGASTGLGLSPPWAGGHWVVLALDEGEQRRLAEFRARLMAWKAADGPEAKRRVGMDATPQLCARSAAQAATQSLRLSAWMRWKAGQKDLLLLDSVAVKDIAPQEVEAPLPLCS